MTTKAKPTNSRVTPKGTPSSPTSASTWKSKSVGGTLLTVPSGNTALVRSPGMNMFLEQGIIPNSLLPFVQEAMNAGGIAEKNKADTVTDLLSDPEKLKDITGLANAAVVYCCIDPVVESIPTKTVMVDGKETEVVIPIGSPDRDPDVLYVDEVDFNDKMFIFSFAVGGPSNLEKFREELTSYVEPVPE